MEDDLDASIIKNTQQSLGKYVKRPPLSEKLLRKPPFRFLHDIVTSVLKSKGFFEGLFDENELISENVKDRESKISFLNKVISVVSLTTGKSLSVKPSKIVAGQEPAKTNELLQCLAQALDNNQSSDEAVKQFKAGAKPTKESVKSEKKNTESKKLTSKSSEKLKTGNKNGQSTSYTRNKENSAHKKDSPPKKSTTKSVNKKAIEKLNQEESKNSSNIILSVKQKSPEALVKQHKEKNMSNEDSVTDKDSNFDPKNLQPQKSLEEDLQNISVITREETLQDDKSISNPSSANVLKGLNNHTSEIDRSKEVKLNEDSITIYKDEIKIDDNETKNQSTPISDDLSEVRVQEQETITLLPNTNNIDKKDLGNHNNIRPASVRPSSSRPGAPRIRDKSDAVINDTENIIIGKINIISENALQEEEESTSLVIENNTTADLYETIQNQEHNRTVNSQKSHLVEQILDSQREFSQISGKTEIEWQFGAKQASDVFVEEMDQLKFSVQALSRIANPLGKLLDHIQEDVEVMRQELQQWTKVYDETSKDLTKQKTANDESLLPFHVRLTQLTTEIADRHEKITDLKISIHRNCLRIEKLLANDNVQ